MKLVIDIDDEEYSEFIKADKNGYCTRMIDIKAIKNGTPLDDIRQEIEEERKSVRLSAFVGNQLTGEYNNLLFEGEHRGLLKALAVIDRHIGSNDAEWKESEPLDEVVELIKGESE